MEKIKTDLEGVFIIVPKIFEDARGYFMETWSTKNFIEIDIPSCFVQDNQSFTISKGTIRGIHFQQDPMAQSKLVRVLTGSIMDYAIDLRKGSPTYKKWVCVELSASNRKQLFIPKGFGHAFITLTDNVTVLYRCDNLYNKELDRSIFYNDPSINIDWNFENVFLSEKDMKAPLLEKSDCNFFYSKNE